jgi:phenylacetate-CoA ligase
MLTLREWPFFSEARRLRNSKPRELDSGDERILNTVIDVCIYAYKMIPFYRKLYDANLVNAHKLSGIDDFKRLPVVGKEQISSDPHCFDRLKYRGLRFKRATSGSTGKPFVFFKDSRSMAMMDAILYRNYSWFGIDIGDKQARFWGVPVGLLGLLKTLCIDYVFNRRRFSAFSLSDENFHVYLKKIRKFRANYIYGYAQCIYQFAWFLYRNMIDVSELGLKAVILTGEMIFINQIELIRSVFRCAVTEEYGCTEVGVIGFRCEFGTMHLMENLYVEVLNEDDNGVGDIVVTESYGRLFPFIRYRVGDRGKKGYKKCECGRNGAILEKLDGRKDDFIVCPNGTRVDPYLLEYIIDSCPKNFGSINQFRIQQKTIEMLDIILVADGDEDVIKAYVLKKIKHYLDPKMDINLRYTDLIERETSGKLRCFVSELGNKAQ